MFSRRSFLQRSSLIALAPTVPTFLARSLRAAKEAGAEDRILVVIQLDGGNDGINTVVPYADEAYAQNRKALRLPNARLIKINNEVALHPSLRAIGELLDDGRLSIVQGVGYPNPNRSHFRSMAIWHTARVEESAHNDLGWAGRALDTLPRSGSPASIFVGPEKLPRALLGRRSVASAMLHNEDLSLSLQIKPQQMLVPLQGPSDDLISFVQRSVLDAYTTADQLSAAMQASSAAASYPNTGLAKRLRLVAQLIKSDLPARVYYAIQSGYDTHAVQLPAHARLLSEFSRSLKAFLDDLAEAKLADRVVVMAFSEFGRRVQENGSLGTDHGTAGPVFVAGPAVQSALIGETPSLGDLEQGDLRMSIDFRQVYATLLEGWLGLSAEAALGEQHEPLAELLRPL